MLRTTRKLLLPQQPSLRWRFQQTDHNSQLMTRFWWTEQRSSFHVSALAASSDDQSNNNGNDNDNANDKSSSSDDDDDDDANGQSIMFPGGRMMVYESDPVSRFMRGTFPKLLKDEYLEGAISPRLPIFQAESPMFPYLTLFASTDNNESLYKRLKKNGENGVAIGVFMSKKVEDGDDSVTSASTSTSTATTTTTTASTTDSTTDSTIDSTTSNSTVSVDESSDSSSSTPPSYIDSIHKVGALVRLAPVHDSPFTAMISFRRIQLHSLEREAPIPRLSLASTVANLINNMRSKSTTTSTNSTTPGDDIVYGQVSALDFDSASPDSVTLLAYRDEVQRMVMRYSQLFGPARQDIGLALNEIMPSLNDSNLFARMARWSDGIIASLFRQLTRDELQEMLEIVVLEQRFKVMMDALSRLIARAELSEKMRADLERNVASKQREFFLREQMKMLRKELDQGKDPRQVIIDKLTKAADEGKLPDYVRTEFNEEINKLNNLEPSASEFNLVRNYLDWIVQLPWNKQSTDNLDIERAIQVLEEDHFGLKDVKNRILEFIAIAKLRGSISGKFSGKIICLVGPPGVGKTSIGKSIARAVDRKYYRFSVGGLSDASEIKGHRRTYVGALPGKIIQSLKTVQVNNPLILIDEIDKLSRAWNGDPSSALLELLDPEQNNSFRDHYLDLPFDLSQVLFVCTANVTDTIPAPLLDRMEVIRIPGYIPAEKVEIAKKYLIAAALQASGLSVDQVVLEDSAIERLMESYCLEAGVRQLQKKIDQIYRKIALDIVQNKVTSTPVVVNAENLSKYVGQPLYSPEPMLTPNIPGIVTGLAWTALGGKTLYVESLFVHLDKPGISATGQLGEVMGESVKIAHLYAQSFIHKHFPKNHAFKQHVHIHAPDGATKKDGPSAGITLVTSLVSLALNKPVRASLAMTGEISLTGHVLKIGGVKEKTIGARRSGCTELIFPKGNESDWLELDEPIREGLTVHFVTTYEDVFKIVFGDLSEFPVDVALLNSASEDGFRSVAELM